MISISILIGALFSKTHCEEITEVDNEDTIIVLESDKAAMEIPASKQGKISKLLVNIGDKVTEGMPFLEIETQDGEIETSSEDKSEIIEEKDFQLDRLSKMLLDVLFSL